MTRRATAWAWFPAAPAWAWFAAMSGCADNAAIAASEREIRQYLVRLMVESHHNHRGSR